MRATLSNWTIEINSGMFNIVTGESFEEIIIHFVLTDNIRLIVKVKYDPSVRANGEYKTITEMCLKEVKFYINRWNTLRYKN